MYIDIVSIYYFPLLYLLEAKKGSFLLWPFRSVIICGFRAILLLDEILDTRIDSRSVPADMELMGDRF
jgi:hypothetical protein